MTMKTADEKCYLGDGLFADFDGWQIRLYTDRNGITHEVFLDFETGRAFESYVAKLRKEGNVL